MHIYLVEELCEGMDVLETLRQEGGRFDEERATELFVQMLRAVHYCHLHGVAHRDLKASTNPPAARAKGPPALTDHHHRAAPWRV